jgi:hypothetical protein
MGNKQNQISSGSALGFGETFWATVDKLRGNLDAAECKHVILDLIFLKNNQAESRTFAALRDALLPKLPLGELCVEINRMEVLS